ncbi:MAG: stage III sporulation protein AA [Clostridia bacterium]|nr:stage III sporulation protein AA [Clostridia bacterium]
MDRITWQEVLLPLFPGKVSEALKRVGDEGDLLEIRLRRGLPMQLVYPARDRLLYAPNGRAMMDGQDCEQLLLRICENSVYAWSDELQNGFITLQGGYRVGISGRAVSEQGRMTRFSEVNSFNFRIVREVRGAAKTLVEAVRGEDGRLFSTLIVSPPGLGKTTLLRDLVRHASYGIGLRAQRVALVDERFELAGCVRGLPMFDVGPRTDIMSGMRKAQAMRRMLAAMSPEVIATDELFFLDDIEAVLTAKANGVTVLASAHGGGYSDLLLRKPMEKLIRNGIFQRIAELSEVGRIAKVVDEKGKEVEFG